MNPAFGPEIINVADMRAIDVRSAALGVSTRMLMENAGQAVADAILERGGARSILVLCGPGNNGGDGYAAARLLAKAGLDVQVLALARAHPQSKDAAACAGAYSGTVLALAEGAPLPEADLYVDALFGAGLDRPLAGAAAFAVTALAATPEKVVAVDCPSGLFGDGAPPTGPHAKAAMTVTFVRKKPAHVLEPSRTACGRVIVADIGTPPQALAERDVRLWENCPKLWRLPSPHAGSHKHTRGRLAVWAGAESVSLTLGAVRLAARAGQRAGAGWVSLYVPPAAAQFCLEPASIVVRSIEAGLEEANGHECVVFGPGAGRSPGTAEIARTLAARAKALVLDADALSAQADNPGKLHDVLNAHTLITPHEGEFARLFPALTAGSKIERVRTAAALAGCVVLLKGADTVIAGPDGRTAVNTHSSPYLASAGTGDVLTGIVGALMAQGTPAFEAAAAGAWLHGECGLRHGPGLIADDLVALLPAVLSEILAAS